MKSVFLFLGALVSASFLATIWVEVGFPALVIWKAAGIVLFGVFALMQGARLAGAGLLFSAAGDVALDLPVPNFIAGMGFFGVAHLLYVLAFIGIIRTHGIARSGVPGAGVVLLISVGLLFWFLPDMGALTAPGIGYQSIITVMVGAALLSQAPRLAKVGAILFMLSDSLIALGLYKDIPVLPGAVWVTYALAQGFLAMGFVAALRRQ